MRSYLYFPDQLEKELSTNFTRNLIPTFFRRQQPLKTTYMYMPLRAAVRGTVVDRVHLSPRALLKRIHWAAHPRCFVLQQPLWRVSCSKIHGYQCNIFVSHVTWLRRSNWAAEMHLAQEWEVGLLDFLCLTARRIYLCSERLCWETCKKKLIGDQILKSSFY